MLPGFGARLSNHPRVAAAMLAAVRRLPGRRARAFGYRHVSRPLVERMAASVEVSVAGGYALTVDTSDVFGRSLATSGTWEPSVTATFRLLLSPGDVCVDVGAHVGYYTILASRLVEPGGHVYALEPAPETYVRLLANLRLNGVSNVTALPLAAGAVEARATLKTGPPSHTGVSSILSDAAPRGLDETTVTVRPVACVVRAIDLERIRLIKVDVEGYELEVLKGIEPILEHVRPAIIIEIHAHRAGEAEPLIVKLCDTYQLNAFRLDDYEVEDRFVSAVNPPRLLAPPTGLPRERYNLLLRPVESSGA